eukprot:7800467-Ditylum_brightwellii.AAC.1
MQLKSAIEYCEEPPVQQEKKSHAVLVALSVTDADGTVYTDLTGKFSVTSTSGAQYMLIAYDYDSNAIIARPLKGHNNT